MPFALITTLPWNGVPVAVIERAWPSGSLSLARALIVTGTSSVVVALSVTATGGSFTGVIVTVTVAVDVRPFPSLIV